jgi:hypothetical protein
VEELRSLVEDSCTTNYCHVVGGINNRGVPDVIHYDWKRFLDQFFKPTALKGLLQCKKFSARRSEGGVLLQMSLRDGEEVVLEMKDLMRRGLSEDIMRDPGLWEYASIRPVADYVVEATGISDKRKKYLVNEIGMRYFESREMVAELLGVTLQEVEEIAGSVNNYPEISQQGEEIQDV